MQVQVLAGTSAGRLERVSHEWVPLFLGCAQARQESPASVDAADDQDQPAHRSAASAVSRIGARSVLFVVHVLCPGTVSVQVVIATLAQVWQQDLAPPMWPMVYRQGHEMKCWQSAQAWPAQHVDAPEQVSATPSELCAVHMLPCFPSASLNFRQSMQGRQFKTLNFVGSTQPCACGGRVWREQMGAWLAFLSSIRGPQRLAQSPIVLRTVAGLLTDADSAVQQGSLACLQVTLHPAHAPC